MNRSHLTSVCALLLAGATASFVVATHFQTVAAANGYWRD